jgi:hypothetical protein
MKLDVNTIVYGTPFLRHTEGLSAHAGVAPRSFPVQSGGRRFSLAALLGAIQ